LANVKEPAETIEQRDCESVRVVVIAKPESSDRIEGDPSEGEQLLPPSRIPKKIFMPSSGIVDRKDPLRSSPTRNGLLLLPHPVEEVRELSSPTPSKALPQPLIEVDPSAPLCIVMQRTPGIVVPIRSRT
jgi:hypothetical protein